MSNTLFKWITALSVIGIMLATYLLWQQFFRPEFKPCNINATVNCDAVVSGEVSKTLGIPTPLIGFVGYVIILISSLKRNAKLVLGMSAFGLIFCLYIAAIEIFKLRVICPVCILCQIDMITVFVLGLKLKKIKLD